MTLSRRAAALSLLGSLFILSAPAFAQDWPTKPIHFITPYPPGGSSDIITRFVADRVTRLLGQPVIVENKPGAGATLGTEYAARAAPDGYAFFVTPMATVTIAPWLRKVGYSLGSFIPVAKLSSSYGLVTTRKDAPFSNYKEFVASVRFALTRLLRHHLLLGRQDHGHVAPFEPCLGFDLGGRPQLFEHRVEDS